MPSEAPDRLTPDTTDKGGSKARASLAKHAITMLGSAALVLTLVWMLLGSGQGFELAWGDGWKPRIVVAAREDALGRVIDAALDSDDAQQAREARTILQARGFHPADSIPLEAVGEILDHQLADHAVVTRALLRDRGFFRVSDPALIQAIAGLAPENPTSVEIRKLLFAMEGPFVPPSTLDGARSQFLTEVLRGRPDGDVLVAEMWSAVIAQTLSFLYPDVKARILRANIPPRLQVGEMGPIIWNAAACRGSHLHNKYIQIMPEHPESHQVQETINVHVSAELPFNQCRNEPLELRDIAIAQTARLGLPAELYDTLLTGADAADDNGVFFSFLVFPAGIMPVGPPVKADESTQLRPGDGAGDAG